MGHVDGISLELSDWGTLQELCYDTIFNFHLRLASNVMIRAWFQEVHKSVVSNHNAIGCSMSNLRCVSFGIIYDTLSK
jgi:hypothetical protein